MKNPEYTIIRRRDDENGNPRYSPIDYASSEQEAKTKVGIARSVKNKNEYGDILFFLKTERISNMLNEEFDVWIVTRKPKPVLIRKLPHNGMSWVDIWEGSGAYARDMIEYVDDLLGQKKSIKALCAAARSLCMGKDFDTFLDACEEWSDSKSLLVDLEAKHNCNINSFFGGSEGYTIVHAIRNYIRFPDFRISHSAEAMHCMALVVDPIHSVVGNLELAPYVRSVVSLKEILLAKANR